MLTLVILLFAATFCGPTYGQTGSGSPTPSASFSSGCSACQSRVQSHKGIYALRALAGQEQANSFKFQVSFRTQIYRWETVNFGYTIQAFGGGLDFSEYNHNPELFLRYEWDWPLLNGLQIGLWEHQSDGQEGSRLRGLRAVRDDLCEAIDGLSLDVRNSLEAECTDALFSRPTASWDRQYLQVHCSGRPTNRRLKLRMESEGLAAGSAKPDRLGRG
jgi:hypothetical protein